MRSRRACPRTRTYAKAALIGHRPCRFRWFDHSPAAPGGARDLAWSGNARARVRIPADPSHRLRLKQPGGRDGGGVRLEGPKSQAVQCGVEGSACGKPIRSGFPLRIPLPPATHSAWARRGDSFRRASSFIWGRVRKPRSRDGFVGLPFDGLLAMTGGKCSLRARPAPAARLGTFVAAVTEGQETPAPRWAIQ